MAYSWHVPIHVLCQPCPLRETLLHITNALKWWLLSHNPLRDKNDVIASREILLYAVSLSREDQGF